MTIERNCEECNKLDARYRCSRCHKTPYCSRECQVKDWSSHKTNCNQSAQVASGSNLIDIVVVDGSQARARKINANDIDSSEWEECVVPKMIGVPLKVKRLSKYQSGYGSREVGIFLMVDPVTGLADRKWQIGCGVLAFAKSDKTNFSVDLFWDVYSYIYDLMDYYGDYHFDYDSFSAKKLNANAFARYCLIRN